MVLCIVAPLPYNNVNLEGMWDAHVEADLYNSPQLSAAKKGGEVYHHIYPNYL